MLISKRFIAHLIIFAISKSAVFLTPLLAASVLSQENYGMFEWSLSFSMVLGVFLSLGAGGVLSFEIVKHENSKLISTALSYAAIFTLLLGIIAAIGILIDMPVRINYILGFTGVFIGQFALSAYMKAKGKGAFASTIESLIYIIVLILVMDAMWNQNTFLEYIGIFSFGAVILSIVLFLLENKIVVDKVEYLALFQRGFPLMVSGILSIGFVNLPRIMLGSVESLEHVAEFSLYFRWAAIALILYQFVLVVYFRKIYTFAYEKLDGYMAAISLLVLIAGCMIPLGIGVIEKLGILSGVAFPKQDTLIQVFMIGGIALWSLNASLEGLFFREHLTKFQIYSTMFGVAVFFLNIIFLGNIISDIILSYTMSWFFAYITMIFVQLLFLRKYLLEYRFKYINYLLGSVGVVGGIFLALGVII
jgi:O-antigen/teichoic acid export membrane protein